MRAESDRKSTRLNSSHLGISYAVFCLKKKNKGLKHSHGDHVGLLYPPLEVHNYQHRQNTNSSESTPPCAHVGVHVLFFFFFFLNTRPPPNFSSFPPPAPFPT